MNTKTSLSQYYYGDEINHSETSETEKNEVSTNEETKQAKPIFKLHTNTEKVTENSVGNTSNLSNFEEFHISEPNLSRIPSPASSIASNRKLEWDSGADIGYNAYDSFKQSRKSKSFPILNMSINKNVNKNDVSMTKMTYDVDETDNQNNIQSSTNVKKFYQCNKKKSFSHSTPHTSKSKESEDLKNNPKANNNRQENKNLVDECLQTTLVHKESKSVQTDNLENEIMSKYFTKETTKSDSSACTSKSSSFQFIPGPFSNSNPHSSTSSNSENMNCGFQIKKMKKCVTYTPAEPDIKTDENARIEPHETVSASSKSTSKSSVCSPLGKIIVTRQSKHLIEDIDKSLHILQKFLKSDKYNKDTKKYYAKKIVSKIIQNKYTEDSTSMSGSSSDENVNKMTAEKDSKHITESSSSESAKSDKNYQEYKEENKKQTFNHNAAKIKNNTNKTGNSEKTTDSHSDTSNRNWREHKTVSERLFESRQMSKPDLENGETKDENYLIQHSKKERKRQLSWISNEINYLRKLKSLLQSQDISPDYSTDKESVNNHPIYIEIPKNLQKSLAEIEREYINKFKVDYPKNTQSKKSNSPETSASYETPSCSLHRLSKYLTADQMRKLINCEAKNVHSFVCECCRTNTELNQNKTNKKQRQNDTYNSHKYYDTVTSHGEMSTENAPNNCRCNKQSDYENLKTDVSTQCSIKSKQKPPLNTYRTNSDNDNQNVEVLYKNKRHFSPIDTSETTSSQRSKTASSERVKTNENVRNILKYCHIDKNNARNGNMANFNNLAYFLTFEEEERRNSETLEKKPLDTVKVKVPKIPKNHNKLDANPEQSLQEHLIKNRPNFVQNAEMRREFVNQKANVPPPVLFTCKQIRQLTESKYRDLPEVQNKKKIINILNQRRQNRNQAFLFSKKLQNLVLKGNRSFALCNNIASF